MITVTSRAGQDYPRTWMHWLHELPVGQTCIHWCGVRFIDGRMGKGSMPQSASAASLEIRSCGRWRGVVFDSPMKTE